jgi:hypothetical protein
VKYIDMAKLSSTMWILIAILIIGVVILGLMGTGYIKSDFSGTSTTTSQPVYSQIQTQEGGKRNKKSSKAMTTSGIYLLLAGVLVGYITSKIV